MIDSVLKGTGNSRFLKSAVPTGTSWADALAMLQAGTFPIDFNGINTDGFQQVGTPLNKANLLKDATAAQIGLPPSITPDGMFRALGNTGELHVWRKTVVSKTPGYNLSVAQKNYLSSGSNYGSGNSRVTFTVSASVSVANDGTVTQNSPSSEAYIYHQDVVSNVQNQIRGKFVSITTDHTSGYYSEPQDGIWFVPADANITLVENGTNLGYPYNYCYVADKMQKVTGYGQGTTTTYPVSTNPNAYQEGEYGKAGYTLGDVKTGTFQIGQGATTIDTNRAIIKYGASISVTDTGTASIASESEKTVTSDTSQSSVDGLKGKFFRFSQLPFSSSAFSVGKIYFFPANTVFTKQSSGNWYASKYQIVTLHGKTEPEYTIEYLGKLGDKARVQVVSYVGTGTYGESNQNSLTFDFVPKMVVVALSKDKSNNPNVRPEPNDGWSNMFLWIHGMAMAGMSQSTIYFTNDGKKLSWYASNYADSQCNESGSVYTAVAIG